MNIKDHHSPAEAETETELDNTNSNQKVLFQSARLTAEGTGGGKVLNRTTPDQLWLELGNSPNN